MICNLSQAFRKSSALHSTPRLKATPWEYTGGASEPLFMEWGWGDMRVQS